MNSLNGEICARRSYRAGENEEKRTISNVNSENWEDVILIEIEPVERFSFGVLSYVPVWAYYYYYYNTIAMASFFIVNELQPKRLVGLS